MKHENPLKKSVALQPDHSDGLLWRYMSLEKFLMLLKSSSLYFCRLENFSDKLEGHFSKGHYEALKNAPLTIHGEGEPEKFRELLLSGTKDLSFITKRFVCVNCWHQAPRESEAMWKLYGQDDKGIAIVTDISALSSCLDEHAEWEVAVSKISYLDYFSETPQNQFGISGVFYKDESYAHEREIRAAIWDKSLDGKTPESMLSETVPNGYNLFIDINKLIKKVVIAPGSNNEHIELIKDISQKYGLDVPVYASQLNDIPEYLSSKP